MRWFSRRVRLSLLAVIVFLALTVALIGIIRAINPELDPMKIIGVFGSEKPTAFRTKPYWSQLTEKQRKDLAPLEPLWDRIAPIRKKKWLEVAQRMEKMSPEEKELLQQRLTAWVNLTPEEREDARKNYLSAKKLDIKGKSLQWQEYQQLPEEEKKKLAAKARKNPQVARSPSDETVVQESPKTAEESGSQAGSDETPDYWR